MIENNLIDLKISISDYQLQNSEVLLIKNLPTSNLVKTITKITYQ